MKDDLLLNNVIKYNQEKYFCFKNNIPFNCNSEYEKILNARYHKVSRVKKRLLYLLLRYDYIWFITFTFDNNYINKSERTKRDLIKSCLNTHDFKYILNVDYGKKNERQHFHCILATNIDFDVNQFFQNTYPCFSLSILCKKGREDLTRLTKYIDKLTNHCLKSTTKSQRLVYNFKGYDKFCPTSHDITLQYKLEYFLFEKVPLLDKGDVNGNL